MKKFLAIVLALTFVLSFGAISFAAADEVAGTLADGTAVTKPVSEVVKSVEDGLAALDAEKAEALKTFFAEAEAKEDATVIAKGIVDFAGAFADATEAEIEVPLAAPGVKAGDKVGVSLSTGTSKTVEAAEDDVVTVAFPKDADGVGYVISSAKEKATWDWPLPPEPAKEEESNWKPVYDANGKLIGYDYSDDTGATGSIRFDDDGNVISQEFNDPTTGEKSSYTATYENGELVEEHASGTGHDENGNPFDYENTYKKDEDGTVTETKHSTGVNEKGEDFEYSSTSTTDPQGNTTSEETITITTPDGQTSSQETVTQPDGTSKVTVTGPDGNTETHYYDADGNEIFPSPEW